MRLRQRLLLLISIIGCFAFSADAWSITRTYSSEFMDYQCSIRNQSMGLSGVALLNGNQLNLYNPALLGVKTEKLFSCYFGNIFWDDFVTSFLLSGSTSTGVSYGIQLLQVYSPGIEKYLENDTYLGTFDATQRYLNLSFTKAFSDTNGVGLSLGYINENYDTVHYNGFVINWGFYHYFLDNWMIGGVIDNITRSKLGKDPIATRITLGTSYTTEIGSASIEYAYIDNLAQKMNIGLDFMLNQYLSLRIGTSGQQWRGGVGLTSASLNVDLSFKPHTLGNSYLMSISFIL